jgi:single-stranded-DNA-specific exonuclease
MKAGCRIPSGAGHTLGFVPASALALEATLDIPPCSTAAAERLASDLGVGPVAAEVLVRRGLADPSAARAWLAADVRHPPEAFDGISAAVGTLLRHISAGDQITIHGDYDVDGVCATAIMVGALRGLGARVDWYIPGRLQDGYGVREEAIASLAARGTRLLVTVDCGITAVAEVACARAAGVEVVVTDHHSPRADGVLPEAPIVHPALCGYPCPELCAAGVAHKLVAALLAGAGRDPALADADLELVALATVADVVALRGENRRLVREGLRALAASSRPGLRALMRVAQVDPSALDTRAVGFRLAPRINAAGRLYRADAGVELLLCDDEARAGEIAAELDQANAERRHTETRILFEAERQVAEAGERGAYVLAGEGWHPGVVGIVASRIVERHHRPAVLIALEPSGPGGRAARGRGSGRSIPGFDLLAGLDAARDQLVRHGGHRAAAGLEIDAERVDAFRAAFTAHAEATLTPDMLRPTERVDAVVSGEDLGLELAEELDRLGPFGAGNPQVSLLVPAARLEDARAIGEGKHVRFTVKSGGARARAVAFGTAGRLPPECAQGPVDATFALSAGEWNGTVEPRLVLRRALSCRPAPIACAEAEGAYLDAVWRELDAPLPGEARGEGDLRGRRGAFRRELDAPLPREASGDGDLSGAPRARRRVLDRRGRGPAATIARLVASGEDVLVVCCEAHRRLEHLCDRLGGFSLCSYGALEREPALAAPYAHLVALDPPAWPAAEAALSEGDGGRDPDHRTHLAWGEAELGFAIDTHHLEYGLRPSLTALYRALRAAEGAEGEGLEATLRGDGPQPSSPALAGRLLRVLAELNLVILDPRRDRLTVPAAERTALERSGAFRAYEKRLHEGHRFLSRATARAA